LKSNKAGKDKFGSPILRNAFADIAAPTLILLAPFVNFLTFNRYNYLQPEIFWLLAPVLIIGLILGLIMFGGGQVVRVPLISIMLSFVIESLFESLGLKLIIAVTLVIAWVLREHITKIVAIAFLVMVLSTVLIPGDREAGTQTTRANKEVENDSSKDLPLVIHLILDEHIGIEGIPEEVENGDVVKKELKAFYENYGFRLYGRAFSQYYNTSNSITNTLNFTSENIQKYYFLTSNQKILKENAYFRLLSDRGYNLRVYQSTYIDFCQASEVRIVSCATYPHNSIKSIEKIPIHSKEKARFIWHSLLSASTSQRLHWVRKKYLNLREGARARGWNLPPWHSRSPRTGPIAPMPVIEEMWDHIPGSPDGTVFFAHLLLPHHPYVYDKNCSTRENIDDWLDHRVRDWHENADEKPMSNRRNDRESRAKRYQLYFEQIQCQQRMLGELFDNMRNAGVFERAIIIIHGDHGSRIGAVTPISKNKNILTAHDYTDGFSTLFAVKLPGLPSGYDDSMAPIQKLLARSLGNEQVEVEPGIVFLRDKSDAGASMVSQPMVWFDQ
jgi:hypothetical protein